jgi:hypothetical protein
MNKTLKKLKLLTATLLLSNTFISTPLWAQTAQTNAPAPAAAVQAAATLNDDQRALVAALTNPLVTDGDGQPKAFNTKGEPFTADNEKAGETPQYYFTNDIENLIDWDKSSSDTDKGRISFQLTDEAAEAYQALPADVKASAANAMFEALSSIGFKDGALTSSGGVLFETKDSAGIDMQKTDTPAVQNKDADTVTADTQKNAPLTTKPSSTTTPLSTVGQ